MYTFIKTYLQLRVEVTPPPWAFTLSTQWAIFPDATTLIVEKGDVRRCQSHMQNVLFDPEYFPQAVLQVALGSFGDRTRTLNQCSYMVYDNISKPDSAESLPFFQWRAKGRNRRWDQTTLPGTGNVETF